MKILLVLPFNIYRGGYNNRVIRARGGEAEIPLGLGYIKAYLKTKLPGVEITIHDANIEAIQFIMAQNWHVTMEILWERLRQRIREFAPDMVGVSAFAHAVADSAHRVVAECKALDPGIYTVMGGAYPTLSWRQAMADRNLDFVVRSEGEVVFCNLVNAILNKKSFDGVNGIVFRQQNRILATPDEKPIVDLDTLPYPDLDDLPDDAYGRLARQGIERVMDSPRMMTMVSSRGCVHQCGFCSTKRVWGTLRQRSPAGIVDEIRYLKSRYDFNYLKFNDDLFSHDPERVKEICRYFIKEKPVDIWGACGVTVKSLLDMTMVNKMVAAGYTYYSLPIDSGCPETLRRIHKPLTLDMASRAISNLRQFDDNYITASFLVGFPFETKGDIKATYRFAASLPVNWVSLNIFTPFPQTPLYDFCLDEGYIEGGEVYRTLQDTIMVSTPHFDGQWLQKLNYARNLEMNFIDNYAVTRQQYEVASREFRSVLQMVPDHAFAHLYLGLGQEMSGDQGAERSYAMARRIIGSDRFWGEWYQALKQKVQAGIASERLPSEGR